MVYWIREMPGPSGYSNGNELHLDQMAEDLKKVIEVL